MKKIMFVCHGNICRSPSAEFIMRDIVKKHGKEKEYFIQSSATSREAIGEHIYYPAKKELEKHGIATTDRRAVQTRKEDYNKYDLFIIMDERNEVNLLKIFGGQDVDNKIHKLSDYTLEKGEIPDPWYTDRFDIAFNQITHGCQCLFEYLETNNQ